MLVPQWVKWSTVACIMLLGVLLSDSYSVAHPHPHNSSGGLVTASWSQSAVKSQEWQNTASHGVIAPISAGHQAQRQVSPDHDGVVTSQQSGLRTEHMQRLREDQPLIPYVLLCEWSMQLVWLLLSGLALCLPLLYKKHALRDRFGQLTSRFWNPKHLQYRFCHTAG